MSTTARVPGALTSMIDNATPRPLREHPSPADGPIDRAGTVITQEWSTRLSAAYYQAGDLAIELASAVRSDPYAVPTEDQKDGYARILDDARALVPHSIALQEDVAEIDSDDEAEVSLMAVPAPAYLTVDSLYRALNTTIVPTLHNALTDIRPEAT